MNKPETYEEIVSFIDNNRTPLVDVIMSNICGDGYDAYARAYNIIEAIEMCEKEKC